MSQPSLSLPIAKQPLYHPYEGDAAYFCSRYPQQDSRLPCMFKTNLCNDPMDCRYCSNSNNTNSPTGEHLNNKPWRIAFFQDDRDHHQFYQHDMLRSTKSTLPQQNNNAVPRRLSSGSACETCRRRKTKCDGGQPCAYCATNRIPCIHRASKKRSAHHLNSNKQTALMMGWTTAIDNKTSNSKRNINNNSTGSTIAAEFSGEREKQRLQWMGPSTRKVKRPLSALNADHHEPKSIMKQASCPSLMITQWPRQQRGNTSPIKSFSPLSPLSDHHSTSSDKAATSAMSSTSADHVTKEAIPSVMDQLSCRTFSAFTLAAVDQGPSYPIYPLVARITSEKLNVRRGYASD
ncbi:hypothetical protein INT45_004471 [Circinella minor]|uniref:Zn(2)-C6 fungal-type domain-containing protein n=1 Tax=Circinella minor TaxID=1195481 RepID=A0A8H7S1A8_9FUNG|nr:hypothetical protein INT45_004471 [Circinella minor]